jgi:predicted amidohydrolase
MADGMLNGRRYTLAAAQICSRSRDMAANLQSHLELVRQAAQQGVQWLVFPELSLTGYELPNLAELAKRMTGGPDTLVDSDLQPLQEAARQFGMSMTVGLPAQLPGLDKPCIGALTLHPQAAPSLYCKQYLHGSEEQYVSPSPTRAPHVQNLALTGRDAAASLGIASAICFDSNQADHPHAAAQAGAQVYAAGVLVSPQGYPGDSALWQQAAQQHGLYVLVANHGGPSGPWSSAGRSACWGPDGRLLGEITGLGAALLVVHIDRTAKPGEVAVSKY